MGSGGGEILRFVVTFLLIGIMVMQSLQNTSRALEELEEYVEEEGRPGDSAAGLSLWDYCISCHNDAVVSNQDAQLYYTFHGGLCVSFDGSLKTLNGTVAVKDYQLLIGGRAMSIVAIFLTIVVSILVEMGTGNKSVVCAASILTVLDFLAQMVLVILEMAFYGKHKDQYGLKWPWIMSFVALALLLVLIFILCCMCKRMPKGKGGGGSSSGGVEAKRGNCVRWVYVVMFLPALAFQLVMHAPEGAKDHEVDGNFHSQLGLWRLCIKDRTDVSWGYKNNLHSKSLCIIVENHIPTYIVDPVLLMVAKIALIICHGATCSGLLLAILTAHADSLKSRMCLFIVRVINVCIMAIAITIACGCCTGAVPDGWSTGYAWALGWVAFAVIWAICIMTIVQIACKKNMFGEAPEADKEAEQNKGEKKKLTEPKDKKKVTVTSPKDKDKEKEKEKSKAEEAGLDDNDDDDDEDKNKPFVAPPPYTEKDSNANRKTTVEMNDQPRGSGAPEPAPPSESEVLDGSRAQSQSRSASRRATSPGGGGARRTTTSGTAVNSSQKRGTSLAPEAATGAGGAATTSASSAKRRSRKKSSRNTPKSAEREKNQDTKDNEREEELKAEEGGDSDSDKIVSDIESDT